MVAEKSIPVDVAVVGGGPAGISACLELSKSSDLDIALFESEAELGGIPRITHIYFGLRDRKRIYTGLAYARKLNNLIRKTSTKIYTNATVLEVIPGNIYRACICTKIKQPYQENASRNPQQGNGSQCNSRE